MRRGIAWTAVAAVTLFTIYLLPARAETTFTPKAGESFTFRIYFAGIALGEQKITATSAKTSDGRPALFFEQLLDSFPSILVDYHEKRTVLWDLDGIFPLAEEATIVQGHKTMHEKFVFDPAQGLATIDRTSFDGTVAAYNLPCTAGTQTGTSLMYYLRTFPWERGQDRLPLLGGKGTEWYTFTVAVENHPIVVPFGRFEQTYHLYNREIKYDVWVDRGPYHLPLEFKSRLGIGVAQAKLVAARNYK